MEFESAIAQNDLSLLMELLGEDDINMDIGQGYTLLHRACEYNRGEIVLHLLHNGADPNIKDDECSKTPLHFAALYGTEAMVGDLLYHDADINARAGMTPLMEASFKGNTSVVRFLLDQGARINDITVQGYTSLFWATVSNRPEAVQVLLNYGANTYITDVNTNRTPQEWAQEREFDNIVNLLENIGI